MTWVLDAPANVYRNHELSSQLRHAAIADAQFVPFARPEPGFGKRKGQSITITRIFPLQKAGRVSELDRLPSGRPLIDTKTISVSEWGFKIPMTEFERNLTHFDITNEFQRTLRDQMRLTLDDMVADAFKTTPIKYTPTTTGGVLSTNGTPGAQADKNLTIADLRVIRDELRFLRVPPIRGGRHVGILSTKAARGLKNDPEYKDWQAPTDSAPFRDSRLRDIENFLLIETNHIDALADSLGLNGVMGEAVFFGADSVALVTVEEPSLRAGLAEDLGRTRDVGWVGTMEAGLVWDIADHARVIHVTST